MKNIVAKCKFYGRRAITNTFSTWEEFLEYTDLFTSENMASKNRLQFVEIISCEV